MLGSGANDFDVETLAQDSGTSQTVETYALVAVEGGIPAGQHFRISRGSPLPILIGQSPACHIRVEDRLASRRHAALDILHGKLHIADLESTNGTWVDGVSVTGAFLREGETIRVGATTFRVQHEGANKETPLSRARAFGRVIGESVEMRRLYLLFERLAASELPVVVEGETGTGKEVLAEALHDSGPRASGPLVVFDCTAVPPNLIESELFGHERGAFTGAVAARKGVFEQANGGTLLIDEIGDLDVALQPKLLRAIERSEIRRVGGSATLRVDVRLIAATRRDLDRAVQLGRFRDDLFHRLAVARVELPPLRRRWGDVPVLARHFWAALGGGEQELPMEVVARWDEHAWPGNVRELRNAVVRQLSLGDLASVRSTRCPPEAPLEARTHLSDFIEQVIGRDLPLPVARRTVTDELERRYVGKVLAQHGGDTAKAAAASGIARRYFQILRARQQKT